MITFASHKKAKYCYANFSDADTEAKRASVTHPRRILYQGGLLTSHPD